MSEHTPLPWRYHRDGFGTEHDPFIVTGPKSQGIATTFGNITQDEEADAEFIVRAVNNHEALLKAAEDLLLSIPDYAESATFPEIQALAAAIEKAGEDEK